jgi:hypothetical protein
LRVDRPGLARVFDDRHLILTPHVIGYQRWCLDEEDVPSDLIASRLREAVRFFDNTKYRNKETRNEGSQEWKRMKAQKSFGAPLKGGWR